MRNVTRYFSILTAIVAAGAFGHSPLAAQKTMLLSAPSAPAVNTRVSEALRLEASAAQEKSNRADWHAAAADFEQAANVRGAKDPAAVADLMSAADIYKYRFHEPSYAEILLAQAGAQAERTGMLDEAVQAYVGAFRIAMRADEVDRANSYLDRLSVLSASPRLSAAARKEFLGE